MSNNPGPGDALSTILGLAHAEPSVDDRVVAAFVGRFDRPTQLQRQALGVGADGRSLLIVAPTATGKTEAGLMPLARDLIRGGGRILYIAPTRALINDLRDRIRPGFGALGLTVEARHGEARATAVAYRAASCIVTTPESFEVAMESGERWLDGVTSVFVDELHAFDGTPRGTQLRVLLTRLRQRRGGPVRVVAASATVPDLATTAREWGRPGAPLTVVREPGARAGSLRVMVGADPEIASWLRRPDAPDKVLLFANSRRRCDELYVSLQGVCDHVVLLHYSNLDAGERADTELLLRRSPRAVCVATSTLELGIDIGDIDTVVLADAPWSALSLVQRVGRSGRRAGEASAVAFAPDDRTLLRVLASWGTDAAEAPGDGLLSRYPSVAVQQAITLTRGSPRLRLRPDRLSSSFEDSPALEGNDATDVLEQLRHDGVLVEHTLSRSYEFAANTLHSDSYERWSNFARDRASWLLAHKGQTMSAVEFDQPPDRGDVILFGGRCWRVTSVVRRTVNVAPTGLVSNPVRIHYSDAPPLVASALASRMRDLFTAEDGPAPAILDSFCATRMAGLRERLGPVVQAGGVPVVWNERGRKLLTFAGTRANLLLRSVIVGASRIDEIGIELERDLPLVELAEIIPSYEEILDSARRGWRRLANSVTTTRWHEMLPTHLRRTEVISQLDGTGVAAAIETLRQGHVVPVEGFGTSL